MATIALEQINKLYPNGFHAVKDLDLDVRDVPPRGPRVRLQSNLEAAFSMS